ncbi:hypothetical protein FHS16_003696 [Paenibacillus endophyticus]|uniref:DUF6630 domain-containing protein n=1 Tax=Paenibacillus endophyticus TaxID=1294268 RepID=A0A7W5C9H0_9BACL|nr:DUF6630 family protein [Paenibacillus endophyticus]MBB3153621.1 hypothetical protein [Paenibacillus endophyticus]
MGLFDFFRKKNADAMLVSGSEADQGLEDGKLAALLALSRRLSAGNEDIVQEVSDAYLAPVEYCEKWQDRLDDRGITGPMEGLPWIALVDALIEERLADEMDWKSEGSTVLYVTRRLIARKQLLPHDKDWSEFEYDEQQRTEKMLETMKTKLEAYGIALACMDMESDSYVLIAVRAEQLGELKQLAHTAGYRIGNHFSS